MLGLLAVLAVAIAGLGIYSYSLLTSARDDLNQATTNAAELQTALTDGDQARAATELVDVQGNVRSASSTLDNPVLSVAAKVPLVGKNITAVRTISSAVGSVANDGLPPLVQVADKFNGKTFNPEGGRINVDAINEIAPNLATSSSAISAANQKIQSIDASSLLAQLRDPVIDAQRKIGDADRLAQRAVNASDVLPRMLEGKHTYLLLFQNNAEIRATGGLPGAYATLEVDNGAIKLGAQDSGASFGQVPEPVLPLTEEEEELFDTKIGTYFLDTTFTPDFPRAAEIATAFLTQERNTDVDGVLSIDPVTLSYLLEGTGPIDLDDGTRLTEANAVEVLLNGVYVNYPDPQAQDALFASATKQIFEKVTAGAGDPTALLKALTRATNERRVALWSKDETITADIAGTPLAHELPTAADPQRSDRSQIGFYLNDATGAKMQYYLDYSVTGQATTCSETGAQKYTSEMTLTSSAPADSASLPESIRGPGFGADPGAMLVNLYLYGPDAGSIDSVEIDNEETTFTRGTHEGRPVVIVTIQLDPGQTATVQSTLTSGPGQKGSTTITETPSIVPGASVQTWKTAC